MTETAQCKSCLRHKARSLGHFVQTGQQRRFRCADCLKLIRPGKMKHQTYYDSRKQEEIK